MSIGLKSFSATCEVWVKPLYKKARPKNMETSWVAESYEEMLGLLKVFYAGKRWKLLDWKELTISNSRVLGRYPSHRVYFERWIIENEFEGHGG